MTKLCENDMSNFSNWNEINFKQGREGIFYKTIAGNNMQMFYIKMQAGQVTDHKHAEEQMGYILVGRVELTIGNQKKICLPGEAYYIPGNVQHGFRPLGDEDLQYIEIFSPPKAEHRSL